MHYEFYEGNTDPEIEFENVFISSDFTEAEINLAQRTLNEHHEKPLTLEHKNAIWLTEKRSKHHKSKL